MSNGAPPIRCTRQPALQSRAAPERAQPDTHPPRDLHSLAGRDVAAGNSRQNGGQRLPEIFGRAQRRQVDAKTLSRIDGSERRRQQLRGKGQQQIRFAVDQIR